jgi:hypothetical protein
MTARGRRFAQDTFVFCFLAFWKAPPTTRQVEDSGEIQAAHSRWSLSVHGLTATSIKEMHGEAGYKQIEARPEFFNIEG